MYGWRGGVAASEHAVSRALLFGIETELAAFGLSIGHADDSVRSTAGNAFDADPCRL